VSGVPFGFCLKRVDVVEMVFRGTRLSVVGVSQVAECVMEFLVRNPRTLKISCAGALSGWKINLLDKSPGFFLRKDSPNLVSTPK